MSLAIVEGIMQFGQFLPTFFGSMLAADRILVSNGPPFFHSTLFRDFFWWQWGECGKIREIWKIKEIIHPGEGQVEFKIGGFTQGRNYSRGIGHAWYPSKIKGCHQTSRETGKNCRKPKENQGKPNISRLLVVPTRALLSSWGDSEGNIKEMGGKDAR